MPQCKKCGAEIYFKQKNNISGAYIPYDPNETPHFETCKRKDPRYEHIICLDCHEGYGNQMTADGSPSTGAFGYCDSWEDWMEHSRVYGHTRYVRWHPGALEGKLIVM